MHFIHKCTADVFLNRNSIVNEGRGHEMEFTENAQVTVTLPALHCTPQSGTKNPSEKLQINKSLNEN